MRFTTIWTLPTLTLGERLYRTVDLAAMTAARHLPQRIRYWTYIQVGSEAMDPHQTVPDAKFMDLLKNVPGGPK
jgi:hypothetical protein